MQPIIQPTSQQLFESLLDMARLLLVVGPAPKDRDVDLRLTLTSSWDVIHQYEQRYDQPDDCPSDGRLADELECAINAVHDLFVDYEETQVLTNAQRGLLDTACYRLTYYDFAINNVELDPNETPFLYGEA